MLGRSCAQKGKSPTRMRRAACRYAGHRGPLANIGGIHTGHAIERLDDVGCPRSLRSRGTEIRKRLICRIFRQNKGSTSQNLASAAELLLQSFGRILSSLFPDGSARYPTPCGPCGAMVGLFSQGRLQICPVQRLYIRVLVGEADGSLGVQLPKLAAPGGRHFHALMDGLSACRRRSRRGQAMTSTKS